MSNQNKNTGNQLTQNNGINKPPNITAQQVSPNNTGNQLPKNTGNNTGNNTGGNTTIPPHMEMVDGKLVLRK